MADSTTTPSISRKKRRIIGSQSHATVSAKPGQLRWRTEAEQQIYSSKLVDVLSRSDPAVASARTFRDAADRVLAVSAKGKTRWSRAILTGRLRFRLAQINKKHKRATKPASTDSLFKKPAAQKKVPPLQRKLRVLSRLVPGCRKLSLPNLLEETTDYISALEMQVKAMTFLTGLLNNNGGGSSADSSDHGQHSNSS